MGGLLCPFRARNDKRIQNVSLECMTSLDRAYLIVSFSSKMVSALEAKDRLTE